MGFGAGGSINRGCSSDYAIAEKRYRHRLWDREQGFWDGLWIRQEGLKKRKVVAEKSWLQVRLWHRWESCGLDCGKDWRGCVSGTGQAGGRLDCGRDEKGYR